MVLRDRHDRAQIASSARCPLYEIAVSGRPAQTVMVRPRKDQLAFALDRRIGHQRHDRWWQRYGFAPFDGGGLDL